MSASPDPILPAKAGTQIQSQFLPFLALPSPMIWIPAFAGKVGILCVGGHPK